LVVPPPKRTITRRSTSKAKAALARAEGALGSNEDAAHECGVGAESPDGAFDPELGVPAADGGAPQAVMASMAVNRTPVFTSQATLQVSGASNAR
jgi:hypothetical protein